MTLLFLVVLAALLAAATIRRGRHRGRHRAHHGRATLRGHTWDTGALPAVCRAPRGRVDAPRTEMPT